VIFQQPAKGSVATVERVVSEPEPPDRITGELPVEVPVLGIRLESLRDNSRIVASSELM